MTDRELNEAVARKLGWIQRNGTWQSPLQQEKYPEWSDIEFPDYCNDIRAAWEIVDSLKPRNAIVLAQSLQSDEWACFVWTTMTDEPDFGVRADTAPRAICEAFLKLP